MTRAQDEQDLDELELVQAEWRANPVGFVHDVLGVHQLYPKIVEMLEAIRDHSRVCVAACHESSKTFTLSCVFWWWVMAHSPSKFVSTAPSARQVEQLLWTEIGARYGAMRRTLEGDLEIPAPGVKQWFMDPERGKGRAAELGDPDWYGVGFATKADNASANAQRVQGYHSPNLLVAFDEADAIPKAVWDAADGLTSQHLRFVAIGNPLTPSSEFARAFRSPDYHSITIDAEEHPNVVAERAGLERPLPYGPTLEWVEFMRRKWTTKSPVYQAKVRGRFPVEADCQLIGIGEVTAARARDPDLAALEALVDPVYSIGVDVARFGSDLTVIFVVWKGVPVHVEHWSGQDTVHTVERVRRLAERYGIGPSLAHRISIDDLGVGGGVTDQLRAGGSSGPGEREWLGLPVNAEVVSEVPAEDTDMKDRRTELWWNMRDWIRTEAQLGGLEPEIYDQVLHDLTTPEYIAEKGTIRLESKKDLKKRLGHSPDYGDALALALAWRTRPVRRLDPPVKKAQTESRRRSRRRELFDENRPARALAA